MDKADGAFLTIGELSRELGVAQHILRYWETRFPQLRPLQRSGNRRYYRPADVTIARQINQLLNIQGFTVRGAQRALLGKSAESAPSSSAASAAAKPQLSNIVQPSDMVAQPSRVPAEPSAQSTVNISDITAKLAAIRAVLAQALDAA
jgi:DNA-binding transcriptional MerR regulator